jgi:hypothetical protein
MGYHGAKPCSVISLSISVHWIDNLDLNHIVVIPCLATASWRKKLFKVSDLVFEVPLENEVFCQLMNMSR